MRVYLYQDLRFLQTLKKCFWKVCIATVLLISMNSLWKKHQHSVYTCHNYDCCFNYYNSVSLLCYIFCLISAHMAIFSLGSRPRPRLCWVQSPSRKPQGKDMSRVPEDAYQHLCLLITKLMFRVHNLINTVLLSSVLLRRCRQLRGHHEDILTINVYQKDLLKTCKHVLRFFNTVIQGISNHWEFRVSQRNLLKSY